MWTCSAERMLTPRRPDRVPAFEPLMLMPLRRTICSGSLAAALVALMTMPLVPATSTDPKVPLQSMVTDLVIVTAPNPPGSRQLISPLTAVFEIAPAKVLQGAVRLQGLT